MNDEKELALPNIDLENIALAGGTVVIVGKWHMRSIWRFFQAVDALPREYIHHADRGQLIVHLYGGGRLIFADTSDPVKFLLYEIQGYCIMEEAWDNLELEELLQSRMRTYVAPLRQRESPRSSERSIACLPASWYASSWENIDEQVNEGDN